MTRLQDISQQFLDHRADGTTLGPARQFLGGNTHHTTHITCAGGTNLCNNLSKFGAKLLGSELLRQILFDNSHLGQFLIGQVLARLCHVYGCRISALLGQLSQNLEGSLIGELIIGSRSSLGFDKILLHTTQCHEAHLILCLHGGNDIAAYPFKQHLPEIFSLVTAPCVEQMINTNCRSPRTDRYP